MKICVSVGNNGIARQAAEAYIKYDPNTFFISDTYKKCDIWMPALKYLRQNKVDLDEGRKIIIFDTDDSCGTHNFEFTSKKNVLGYIKKQVLKDRSLYKYIYPRNRYHYSLISKKPTLEEDPLYSYYDFNKIYVGVNIASYSRNFDELRFQKNKKHDVHFSGTIDRNTKGADIWYTAHRRKAYDILKNKYDKVHKSKLSYKEYIKELGESRIIVAPYGFGEICFRELEAMALGTLVVKPQMSHLETYPDLFLPNETFIEVDPDWSNLESTIDQILDNYDKYDHIRKNAYNKFIEGRKQKNINAHIKKTIGSILK